MNLWGPTVVLYLLAGIGVAGALYLSDLARTPAERGFQVISALVFWPLYLPLLLARGSPGSAVLSPAPALNGDELTAAIAQADAELEAALASLDDWGLEHQRPLENGLRVLAALDTLDGWAEGVVAREKGRIRELRRAWSTQAQRIRDMDRLLASLPLPRPDAVAGPEPKNERVYRSEQTRLENLGRLRQVRERAYQELLGSLAWVRELVSRIHLAKFTGAPPSRAEELIGQIAAAVEGLACVTFQEDVHVPLGPEK